MSDRNEQAFVGNIPDNYDRHLGPVLFVDFAETMAGRVAALSPAAVLETAAGTGFVSRALRNHLPAGTRLTVTDLNEPMLEIARRKLQPGDAEFATANALDLPFADASFDVVLSQYGVMFYPDREKACREAFRVLRPGGSVLLSVWDAHAFNPPGRIGHAVLTGFFPVDPPQFLKIPYSCTFEDLKGPLLAAGFDELSATTVRIVKTGVDVVSLARGFVHGNPTIDQIRARGLATPEAVVEAMAQAFAAEFGNPGTVPLQSTFIAARKPG